MKTSVLVAALVFAQFGLAQQDGKTTSAVSAVESSASVSPGFDCFERVDPPEFPESALQSRVDATVWATFEVTPRAAPDKVEIEVVSAWNDGPTLFAPAVEQTIRASKFKPECAGKTVAVVYRYELRGEAIAAPKVTQRADARVMYLESQPLLARSAPVQPTPTLAYTLPNISKSVSQIVLITTPSWTSTTGTLQRLERQSGSWIPVGRKIAVAVGSKGLGWGKGIHTDISAEPQKHEGDRRAPAGIFHVGPAFGYSPKPGFDMKIPYKPITDRDYFVDDPGSDDYNRWVTINADAPNEPEKKWKSYEVMKRPDDLYKLGLVIQQNVDPTVKGRGSAVFFHIWRRPGSPTVGCTSMAEGDLEHLIGWLDPAKSPIVVEAPSSQLDLLAMKPAH
jgi:L,D-peptidoglycan transpeptidase YkuD (ErfK/YbiS/YcfS/YnhG family)